MSNSPLTKVPTSALSPVSALAFRKPDQVPQALSKQAIDLQNTLNKLKEAKQKKLQLSNSNIVVQSITNPVSSPQKVKDSEESEPMQIQYKSLFKDIESPLMSQPKTYNKMNDQEAEQKYEQRKKQIKEQIDRTKSNSKIIQKPKQKQKKTVENQIQKIDLSKNSNQKQKQESVPEVKTIAPQKPKEVLHDQLKVMQNKLKQDIAKLDKQIKGENQTCLFEIKNKGHDLYQQGLQMEDRKQFKQKIHEREKKQKEMQECTFKPQISQPKTLNNQSRQVQSRIQQNESKLQLKCQSHRDGQVTSKRLSCSPSQDQINSTTMTQTMNNTNDIHSYLNRIQDKYQQIVNRANALKIKGL
ncbi:unnamed protein product (macronuclear) [Paramecium tetraurelia]|uniref:Uncharacterized protein n=1 Tax=Paramecium tetraurelia TaxID=5888 RepID=A0BTX8_PARTE|nr:uncharacterized protein GSPATT00032227001 [Paramecium tetraurelia]CAK61995.1 unnamed protein product [Paramecium tetraurelia]|eukprot:XP_001429393.1 hypothetical protein (macronuclear) [Paramecium tetraurelia strain d4-2]